MSTKQPKSRNVTPPRTPPSDGSATLTRAEVAIILQCSESSVRRMEGDTLHPTADPAGKHLFDPVEVAGVAKERMRRAVDPSREGERDGRAFELLDAGHGIRDLVTRLRIPADVAKRLAETWREAGGRDVVVTAACRAELTRCLGNFREAAELVQRARAASAEIERGYEEHMRLQNRMGSLAVLIGELAARIPALEEVLPEVRAKLDPEFVETLERAFAVSSQQRASVGRAARRNEPVAPSKIASPDVIHDEAVCTSASALAPSIVTGDATPTDAAVAAGDAAGPAKSEAVPRANGCSLREHLLDAWLTSLGADDARVQRLAALLRRGELEMFAELERGIGGGGAIAAESGSSRLQILDALLVSITEDDARLEKIGALLTSQELDMLVELGRGLPELKAPISATPEVATPK